MEYRVIQYSNNLYPVGSYLYNANRNKRVQQTYPLDTRYWNNPYEPATHQFTEGEHLTIIINNERQ